MNARIRKRGRILTLLLAAVALGAAADPAPVPRETATAPAAEIPYASVVDLPADCAPQAPAAASFDPYVCSDFCSQSLCKGKPVNSPCGFGGSGPARFCYELGDVCSDGPACRCTNVPP